MAKQVQLRRGNTAQTSAFTGAVAEVTVNTDTHELVVHDGVTVGGFPIATKEFTTTALNAKADAATLSAVALSGNYNDLTNKPTIPSLTGYATEAYVNQAVAAINPVGTDEYTKTEVDGLLSLKSNAADLATVATSGAYADLTGLPTIPSLTGYATETFVSTSIQNVLGAAPAALDTLKELADALGGDANFASTMTTQLALKANSADLAAVATSGLYADLYNKPDLSVYQLASSAFSGSYTDLTNKPAIPTVPTIVSAFTNDAGYTTFSGAYADLTGKPTLATVATTGAYTDLVGRPTLFNGDYNSLTNKPTLFSGAYADLTGKPVLFSGSYNDLTDKPALFSGSYTDLTNKPAEYVLPTASDTVLGGVKVGTGLSVDGNGVLSATAGNTGDVTFSASTVSTANTDQSLTIQPNGAGELYLMSNVGVHNSNPGYCLHVGNISEYAHTGEVGFSFNDGDAFNGTAHIGWAWENSLGAGNNITGVEHAKFGIFKNGSTSTSWLSFDKATPADALHFDSTGVGKFAYGVKFPDGSVQTTAASLPTLATVATTGSYNDLSNKPTLAIVAGSGDYLDLINAPDLGVYQLAASAFSGDYNDLANAPQLFSGSYTDLSNKPTLFSGSYTDLTNKPALSAVATSGHYADLIDAPAIANVVPVPTSSIGSANDQAEDIAFDANYFYYCVANYDGTTHIWRRIANDAQQW